MLKTFVLLILAVHSDLWLCHIYNTVHLQLSHFHSLRIDIQSTITDSCLYFLSNGGSRKLFHILKQFVFLSNSLRDSPYHYLYESCQSCLKLLVLMSIFLISWIVQSKISYVDFSTGTANTLCAMVLLKVESLDFYIFLTLVNYSLEILSLMTVPTYDLFSSCPKYL